MPKTKLEYWRGGNKPACFFSAHSKFLELWLGKVVEFLYFYLYNSISDGGKDWETAKHNQYAFECNDISQLNPRGVTVVTRGDGLGAAEVKNDHYRGIRCFEKPWYQPSTCEDRVDLWTTSQNLSYQAGIALGRASTVLDPRLQHVPHTWLNLLSPISICSVLHSLIVEETYLVAVVQEWSERELSSIMELKSFLIWVEKLQQYNEDISPGYTDGLWFIFW